MKCSPFSKKFSHHRNRNWHAHHHRINGSFMNDDNKIERDDHHKMEHGHHKFYKMRRGHHMHHRKHGKHHSHNYGMHHKMKWCKRSDVLQGEELKIANECCANEGLKGAVLAYEPKSKAQVTRENNKFQICLDTSYYQPTEVSVKVINGKVKVSAVHECMEEEKLYEFHEMYRTFDLPEDINPENITSRLDSEGKLTIEAPITIPDVSIVRDIPIIQVSSDE